MTLIAIERRTMGSSKAIRVDLGAQPARLQRHLDSGRYEDASDVVRNALRALDHRGAVLDEVLREEVRASLADKRPGSPIDTVFKRVRAKVARKVNPPSVTHSVIFRRRAEARLTELGLYCRTSRYCDRQRLS